MILTGRKPDKPKPAGREGLRFFGGMFVTEDEDPKKKKADDFGSSRTSYTVMIGDLCYVAIGQIANRHYWAVRYQPTAIIYINSVPNSKKLRDEVLKEWKDVTAEKHRDSLVRDLLESDEYARNGASLRLAYYYPDALEGAALKQLARPTYNVFAVERLIRNELYPAKSAKERKGLVEAFVKKHGEVSRDAIRCDLFDDLSSQEADEEGRVHPKLNPRHKARECLIEIFGLPANVKSKDAPKTSPLSETAQARFLQTLIYDPSAKLDQTVRDILAKTDDDYMAQGCLDRLVGRGFDTDIEAYLKRRINKEYEKTLRSYEAKLGWTRLHAAVDLGIPDMVETAIKNNVPIDAKSRDGRTALHLAAADGKASIVEELVRAKASTAIKDANGRLPVELAAHADHIATVKLLVEMGSTIPDVFVSAIVGDANRMQVLLKEEAARVKLLNGNGLTPLHVAARQGHVAVVRALIGVRADVKATDSHPRTEYRDSYTNGWTPLHLAAMNGHREIAEVLLDKGAEINAVDKYGGFTPLHYAAWNGNADLIRLLLKRGADRNAKAERDRTPLDLAEERKNEEAIRLLR